MPFPATESEACGQTQWGEGVGQRGFLSVFEINLFLNCFKPVDHGGLRKVLFFRPGNWVVQ